MLYDQKWKDKYISQMTNSHIINTIARLKRNDSEYACKWFERELELRAIGKHLPKSDLQKLLESVSMVEYKEEMLLHSNK